MDVAVQDSPSTATYAVPKRFGMAGILAITTFMAVLFGILRSVGAPPVLYIFLGLLTLVTCLVQMRYGDVPRFASIAAGALFLPLCAIAVVLFSGGLEQILTVACSTPILAFVGAFLGYLSGACTAGLFLLMDLVEPYLPGGKGASGRPPRYARQLSTGPLPLPDFAKTALSWLMADDRSAETNPFKGGGDTSVDSLNKSPDNDPPDWCI